MRSSTRSSTTAPLVKVDIEGHEPSFLRGSSRFLSDRQPACIIEANHWCLDALTNVTMPMFLNQVFDIFPHVYAFDAEAIVDVRERQTYFMHENIVHTRFANLYCDFDSRRVADVVVRYSRFLQANSAYTTQIEQRIAQLDAEVVGLRTALDDIKQSRSHRAAMRLNRLLGR